MFCHNMAQCKHCVLFCPGNGTYLWFKIMIQTSFCPPSRSLMSKLFRFSESLGKSNAKKWSEIWKLLLIKSVKSPRRKKLFMDVFFFFICSLWSPLSKIQCPNFLDFKIPWEKVMKKVASDLKLLLSKGVKLKRDFLFDFFGDFFLNFFGIGASYHIGREMLSLLYAGFLL